MHWTLLRKYKMKIILFAFLFLAIAVDAKSQVINLDINLGYGFYDLEDIKNLQNSILTSVNIPNVKAVEKFPNNIYYSISVNHFINNKNGVGIGFTYLTTGGRNHLADYSGEYKLDMLLNGYKIGPKFQHAFFLVNKMGVWLQLEGGAIISKLNVNEALIILDEEISKDQMDFKSKGLFVEPSLKVSYNVVDRLNIHFSGGYDFNFKGNMRLEGKETAITANWSGIRLFFGIDYSLDFKKE